MFELPKGLPPTQGEHYHSIFLNPSSQHPNVFPYQYPFAQKNEIENIIQEILTTGVIKTSNILYSSPIVIVLKKEDGWHMYPDFQAHNQLNIKDKFHIPITDDLLDQLHGTQFFTKMDLRPGYH